MIRKVLAIVAAAVVTLTLFASPAGASSAPVPRYLTHPAACPNGGAFLQTHYCLGHVRHHEWLW